MRIRRRTTDPPPQLPPGTSSRPPSPPSPSPPPAAAPATGEAAAVTHLLRPSNENHQIDVPALKPEQEQGKSEQELGLPSQVSSREKGDHEDEKDKTVMAAGVCKKGDGKGWKCKREAQWGYSLCQYHLEKLRSYSCYSRKKKLKADPASDKSPVAPPTRSRRTRQTDGLQKKPLRISDSFYYYSGFGPLWRKRRSDKDETKEDEEGGGEEEEGESEEAGEEEEDSEEAGEEEEGESEEAGEGKPVKSRALSSIL